MRSRSVLRAVEVAGGGEADGVLFHAVRTTRSRVSANARSGYDPSVGYTPSENLPLLIETMKRACAALDEADVPAMLGGGLATWARAARRRTTTWTSTSARRMPQAHTRHSRPPG